MSTGSNVAPGYYVVQQPGTLDFQARLLFTNINSAAARFFMKINNDTPWVKSGQILIVADPASNDPVALKELVTAKSKVNNALNNLNADEAVFFHQHYSTIAAVTNFMDKSLGIIGDAGEKYFKQIESKLKAIELSYQNQFRSQGTLISQQFFIERQKLFAELNILLNKISRLVLTLKPYENLKRALGLSSKAIVHEWSTAGVGAIRGYSTYVDKAASAARYMKMGGWLAIGFAGLNTTNEVYNACTTGREKECAKVAVKEYSKFGASVAGGIYGGQYGGLLAGGLCVALGVATAGTGALVCTIVGAAAGGYIGGEAASGGMGYLMDKIL